MSAILRQIVLASCLSIGTAAAAGDEPAAGPPTLAPGDLIDLSVYGRDDLAAERVIDQGGDLLVPLLGRIRAAGLTPEALEAEVARALEAQALMAAPSVQIAVARWRDVFLLGDVISPGAYGWRPGLTAEQAVGLAGGERRVAQDQLGTVLQAYGALERAEATRQSIATLTAQQARLEAEIAFVDAVFGADGLPLAGAADRLATERLFPDGGAAPAKMDRATFRTLQAEAGGQTLIVFPDDLAENPGLAGLRGTQQTLLVNRIDLMLATTEGLHTQKTSLSTKIERLSEQQEVIEDAIARSEAQLQRLMALQDQRLIRTSEIENYQTSLAGLLSARIDLLVALADSRSALEQQQLQIDSFPSDTRARLSEQLETVQRDLSEVRSRLGAAERGAEVARQYLALDAAGPAGGAGETLVQYRLVRVTDGVSREMDAEPGTLLQPGDTVSLRILDAF